MSASIKAVQFSQGADDPFDVAVCGALGAKPR